MDEIILSFMIALAIGFGLLGVYDLGRADGLKEARRMFFPPPANRPPQGEEKP
jgi:hypothetical protein